MATPAQRQCDELKSLLSEHKRRIDTATPIAVVHVHGAIDLVAHLALTKTNKYDVATSYIYIYAIICCNVVTVRPVIYHDIAMQ